MTWVNAVYLNKSICLCGETALRDEVPLGKVYRADLSRTIESRFTCGNCRSSQTVAAVLVEDETHNGYLPLGLFFLPARP